MVVADACFDPDVADAVKVSKAIARKQNKILLGGVIRTSIKKNKEAFAGEALNVNEEIKIS